MPSEDLLQVESLSKTFAVAQRSLTRIVRREPHRLVALDGVSITARTHEIVGIVGESGSGKSTLAKCLVRLTEPDAGSVLYKSRNVLKMGTRDLAATRRAMQMIYQDPYSSLNPLMSVGAAIAEAATVHGLVAKSDRTPYVAQALDMVGLSPALAARRPRELSGGQRQRVAIARAMAVKPDLLIADEAVSALDVSVQAQVLKLFAGLRDEQGVAIVFIAHNLSVVASIADRVNVMYLGAIMESGPTDQVFSSPAHPYTAALLQAQPGRHQRQSASAPALDGEIPSPLNIPTGCRFRTRCPLAQDICAQVAPLDVELSDGRTAKCHFAEQVASGTYPLGDRIEGIKRGGLR
jgi:oligopeptide transport system ATP-binding protein